MRRNFGKHRRRAAAMMMALVVLLVVGLVSGMALRAILQSLRQTRQEEQRVQAELLADAALSRAVLLLQEDANWKGESWTMNLAGRPAENADGQVETKDPKTTGVAVTLVEKGAEKSDALRISVSTIYPNDPIHRAQAKREMTYAVSQGDEKP